MATPEIIDLVDEDPDELLEAVTETDDVREPLPEPMMGSASAELLERMKKMDDTDVNEGINEEDTRAMAEAWRVALDALGGADGIQATSEIDASPGVRAIVEEYVVVVEEEEPSWLEETLGPWAARHRTGLHVWLLSLLVVYVSLFASMLYQDSWQALSERTAAAAVRDLLWAVLIVLILLLSIGKHYQV